VKCMCFTVAFNVYQKQYLNQPVLEKILGVLSQGYTLPGIQVSTWDLGKVILGLDLPRPKVVPSKVSFHTL